MKHKGNKAKKGKKLATLSKKASKAYQAGKYSSFHAAQRALAKKM